MNNFLTFLKTHIGKILCFFKIYFYIKKLVVSLWKIKYHYKTLSLFSQFVKRGDLCFDIGANVGQKTKYFLLLGAKVVCVEPQSNCIIKLIQSYRRNKNVIVVGKAVGSKEGHGDIHICNEYHTLSTLSNKWISESNLLKKFTWIKTQRVAITTLDKLIQMYGLPKFCKIDVEGYEKEVFKGLTKKIPIICFEFTKEFLNEARECINYLLSLGPVKFNLVIGEGADLALSKWVDPDKIFRAIDLLGNNVKMGDIYAKFI